MITPPFTKTLQELLPADAQLLFGLLKAGGVVIEKQSETITISNPYIYDINLIQSYIDALNQFETEYLQQVQTENNDPTAQIPDNEQNYINEVRKILNQIITGLR
jgi:hypothetical protein